jgi:hypothetical protein
MRCIRTSDNIAFKKLKTYSVVWRRHTWCAKCCTGFDTEALHAILLHSYFQGLLPPLATVVSVAVGRDLVVHMSVSLVKFLQKLVMKVLWLVVQ